MKQNKWYFDRLIVMAIAFMVSFFITRTVRQPASEWVYIVISGDHIHHFVTGGFITFFSLALCMFFDGNKAKNVIALISGAGFGMIMDELDMWVRLVDDGYKTYDGLFVGLACFAIIAMIRLGNLLLFKKREQ